MSTAAIAAAEPVVLGMQAGGAAAGSNPVGRVDGLSVKGDVVTVNGWAGDADATSDQRVHFYVDGKAKKAVSANGVRGDVVKAYPTLSPRSGFSTSMTLPVGVHTVCIYAINQGGGANTTLACRTVTIGAVGHDPIGRFETIGPDESDGAGFVIRGWAVDQDRPHARQTISVSVNGTDVGRFTDVEFPSQSSRPDVAKVYPWAGNDTGFEQTIYWPGRGWLQVCVTAINSGAAPNVLLGCRWHDEDRPGAIVGHIDRFGVDPASPALRTVSGWVLNPYDALSPTEFALVSAESKTGDWDREPFACNPAVSGCSPYFSAGLPRADVDRAYPKNGTGHGFVISFDPTRSDWKAGDTICLGTRSRDERNVNYYPDPIRRFCTVYPG